MDENPLYLTEDCLTHFLLAALLFPVASRGSGPVATLFTALAVVVLLVTGPLLLVRTYHAARLLAASM